MPVDPVCDIPDNWCFDKNTVYKLPAPSNLVAITSCFHRITATGTATEPPPYGDGWEKIFDTTWWRCPVPGESFFGRMNRGRFFANVLDHMGVNGQCPLIVRSHFFNINATHAAPPDNIAYDYAAEHLSLMTIHQKSDVKRPDATNPAQDFVFKLSKISSLICFCRLNRLSIRLKSKAAVADDIVSEIINFHKNDN